MKSSRIFSTYYKYSNSPVYDRKSDDRRDYRLAAHTATYEAAEIAGNRLLNVLLSLFKLIFISILAMNMKDKLLSLID
ncbi:hypothetical protein PsorP6_011958 [Peronosclerospora sorghi]|uniref:Uncharacterized protein n=1 Tax=Peronosclerospora sorghi TaxID=230839 RepID=A0ACC0WKA2_9STRA|nr:hypothetical protein PsorP6_011958 [Peronosclerospora sorghi]